MRRDTVLDLVEATGIEGILRSARNGPAQPRYNPGYRCCTRMGLAFPLVRVGAAPSLTLGPPGGPDPDQLADGWQASAGGRSTPRRPPCTPRQPHQRQHGDSER